MRIEIFKGTGRGTQLWYWRFRQSNGRIVANNEAFPTKANAKRSACSVVRGICKAAGVKKVSFIIDGITYSVEDDYISIWRWEAK